MARELARANTRAVQRMYRGEVGYIVASIKNVADTRVGDTITDDARPTAHALPR